MLHWLAYNLLLPCNRNILCEILTMNSQTLYLEVLRHSSHPGLFSKSLRSMAVLRRC
jgi:hypothetical protein